MKLFYEDSLLETVKKANDQIHFANIDKLTSNNANINHNMLNMLSDVCCLVNSTNFDQDNMNVEADAIDEENINNECESFDYLYNEVGKKLYLNCKLYVLTFVVKLMNLKVLNLWSNKSLDMWLTLLVEVLPKGSSLLKKTSMLFKKCYTTLDLDVKKSMHVNMILHYSKKRIRS